MNSQTCLSPMRSFILQGDSFSRLKTYRLATVIQQAQSNSSAIPLVKHQHTPPFSHTPSNARKAVFANTLSGNSRNARS